MTARVPPRRERGVALIAAVLVVALATVLVAAMLDRGEAARARTRNILRAEQGWQLMRGLEGWAALALRRDAETQWRRCERRRLGAAAAAAGPARGAHPGPIARTRRLLQPQFDAAGRG
jgi:type II secretory pathway component PulK